MAELCLPSTYNYHFISSRGNITRNSSQSHFLRSPWNVKPYCKIVKIHRNAVWLYMKDYAPRRLVGRDLETTGYDYGDKTLAFIFSTNIYWTNLSATLRGGLQPSDAEESSSNSLWSQWIFLLSRLRELSL